MKWSLLNEIIHTPSTWWSSNNIRIRLSHAIPRQSVIFIFRAWKKILKKLPWHASDSMPSIMLTYTSQMQRPRWTERHRDCDELDSEVLFRKGPLFLLPMEDPSWNCVHSEQSCDISTISPFTVSKTDSRGATWTALFLVHTYEPAVLFQSHCQVS